MKKRMIIGLIPVVLSLICLAGCTKSHEDFPNSGSHGGSTTPSETIKAVQTNDWTITYVGRQDETLSDGTSGQFERFRVTPSLSASSTRYIFDLLSTDKTIVDDNGNKVDELQYWYGGDLLDFFEDDLNIAQQNGNSPLSGQNDIDWNRLLSGNYRLYVFGVDSKGKATGRYSTVDLCLRQETPLPEYSKWLGQWKLFGKAKNNYEVTTTYDISIEAAESNYSYYVDGWEWGSKETDMNGYWFQAWFNKNAGNMVFTPYVSNILTISSSGKYPIGTYEVMLAGNYFFNGLSGNMTPGEYHYIGDGVIAETAMKDDGTAQINPWNIKLEETGYTTPYTSMQFWLIDTDANNTGSYKDFILNYDIPIFPLNMIKVTASQSSSVATRTVKDRSARHISSVKARSVNPMGRPSGSRSRPSSTTKASDTRR